VAVRDPDAARAGGDQREREPRYQSDQRDAFGLAEKLRVGAVERRVVKEVGAYRKLRELGRVHAMVVRDSVRVQNRIKSFIRSRGVAVEGKAVYVLKGRKEYLESCPIARGRRSRLCLPSTMCSRTCASAPRRSSWPRATAAGKQDPGYVSGDRRDSSCAVVAHCDIAP
jgi:hypothetical protein